MMEFQIGMICISIGSMSRNALFTDRTNHQSVVLQSYMTDYLE